MPQKYRHLGGTGRAYASWLSLQNCTRECRKESLQLDGYEVYELDQQNAQPSALLHFLKQSEGEISQRFKLIELFCATPKRWKDAICRYYGCDDRKAKEVVLKIMFGGSDLPEGEYVRIPIIKAMKAQFREASIALQKNAFSEKSLRRYASRIDLTHCFCSIYFSRWSRK